VVRDALDPLSTRQNAGREKPVFAKLLVGFDNVMPEKSVGLLDLRAACRERGDTISAKSSRAGRSAWQ
jgi:hypothetical protein